MVRPNHPPGAQSIIRAVRLLKALPNSWFDEIGLVDLEGYEVGILHRYYPND
jgi:hypothetical protein